MGQGHEICDNSLQWRHKIVHVIIDKNADATSSETSIPSDGILGFSERRFECCPAGIRKERSP